MQCQTSLLNGDKFCISVVKTLFRYIYGYSLFFGWGGGVLLLLGALFILCTSCLNADSYEDERPHYSYRPPTKSVNTGQEYI